MKIEILVMVLIILAILGALGKFIYNLGYTNGVRKAFETTAGCLVIDTSQAPETYGLHMAISSIEAIDEIVKNNVKIATVRIEATDLTRPLSR